MQEYTICIGLVRAGCVTYESIMLPEYSMGMIHIAATNGQHFAFNLNEVSGVVVTPKEKE